MIILSKMKNTIVVLLMLISCSLWGQSNEEDVQGYWLNEKGASIVEVYIIDNELRGRIVWLEEELNHLGQLKRDVMNKDPMLRSRLLVGIDVFYDFELVKDTWKHGHVYNYQNGHQYNAKLRIDEDGNLIWTGYYGILVFLSRTKKWTRVTDLQKYGLE